MDSLSFSGWQENLRPLLTRDPTVYGRGKPDSASEGLAPRYIDERRPRRQFNAPFTALHLHCTR
jgi:hypothetical protein